MSDSIKKCRKWQQKGGNVLLKDTGYVADWGFDYPKGKYLCLKTSRAERIGNLKWWYANGGEIEFHNKYHQPKWVFILNPRWHPTVEYRKHYQKPKTEPKRTPEMEASLKHWRHISTLTKIGQFKHNDKPFSVNCALCKKHLLTNCMRCDIKLCTEQSSCRKTPYSKAVHEFHKLEREEPNTWPEASLAEVKFLESVPYPGDVK